MLVKNPYRYHPRFIARIVYADGSVCVRRGDAEGSELYLPGEEEDIRAVALVIQDAGNHPVAKAMWVDGKWQEYKEELLNQIERDAQEPKPESKLESEVEVEVKVESAVVNENSVEVTKTSEVDPWAANPWPEDDDPWLNTDEEDKSDEDA